MRYEKTAKDAIMDVLRTMPNTKCSWDNIKNLLTESGYNIKTLSWAKSKLVEEGVLEEFVQNGVKYVQLKVSNNFKVFDDKLVYDYYDYIVRFFSEMHKEDIINDIERIEVDLTEFYNYCSLIGLDFEFIEWIINNPEEALKLFRECYEDAYYKLNSERPKEFILEFKNLPKIYKTVKTKFGERDFTIEDIKSRYIGKLVEFEGIITIASKIIPMLKKAVFLCPKCGKKIVREYDNIFEPFSYPKCCETECILLENESKYIDVQEFKLQQPLDLMEKPEEPPRYITVIYENSPGIYSGRVRVVGIPFNIRKKKNSLGFDIYVKAIHVELIDNDVNINLSPEDIEKIEKIGKRRDVVDLLADMLIPEIRGHSAIKKAIFLQQIKGTKKRDNTRHNIHILLITDPGVGKSVMLRKIAQIPGNEYSSLTSATGVGLTAAVVREKTLLGTETWVIKPGVLVRANGGTACIDEFSVQKNAHNNLLEAMESQTIHVSKGGINAKLLSECAILAACNPRWGRFNPDISVAEQIDISPQLLSRFDLIFPLMDKPNRENDEKIAEHILNRFSYASSDKEIEGYDYKVIDGIKIDFEFIVKYIMYARQKKAILSEKAKKTIIKYYLEMRKLGEGNSLIPITARQLEAVARLAEAIAKAKLKETVDVEDAEEAISIIDACLKEVAYDPETGRFDVDKIMGVHKSERKKLDIVLEIIKELSHGSLEVLVDFEEILSFVEEKGINEKELERLLNKLKKLGDIDEPKPRRYRLI
jgi:replicative DNA helicase Mcm